MSRTEVPSKETVWCNKCGCEVPRSIAGSYTSWDGSPRTYQRSHRCTTAEPGIGSAHNNGGCRGPREVAADIALVIARTHKFDGTPGNQQIAPILAQLETNFANTPVQSTHRNRLDELLVFAQSLMNRASAINMASGSVPAQPHTGATDARRGLDAVNDIRAMIAEAHKYDGTPGGRSIEQALADLERQFGRYNGSPNEDDERERLRLHLDWMAEWSPDFDREAEFKSHMDRLRAGGVGLGHEYAQRLFDVAQRLMRSAAAQNMFGGV